MLFTRKTKTGNLTEGPLFPQLVGFIFPLALMSLLQAFYNAADIIVVRFSGVSGAIGAIGSTTSSINLFQNTITGLSIGCNVVVARCIGAKDREGASRGVQNTILLMLIFGFFLAIVGNLVTRPLLAALGAEGHILEMAVTYMRIVFLGGPFICATNYVAALFRANGDARTPLLVSAVSGLLNVALNFFFVMVVKMDVAGVALATLLSNAVSGISLFVLLCRQKDWLALSLRELHYDGNTVREMLRVGIPSAIQTALFSISNVMVSSSVLTVNNMLDPGGSSVIDGNSAVNSIESFVSCVDGATYSAALTFTSQHVGARKYDRIFEIRRFCILIGSVCALLMGGLIYAIRYPLLHFYVTEEAAVNSALARIRVVNFFYAFCAFMNVGTGVLRGLGKSLQAALITLVGSVIFRVLWLIAVFPLKPSMGMIYVIYPISWLLTGLIEHRLSTKLLRKMTAVPQS